MSISGLVFGGYVDEHKKVAAIGFEPTTQEKVKRKVVLFLGVD